MANAVAVISALAALLGVVLWLRREALVDYAAPPAKVSTAIYRYLELTRDTVFGGSQNVRFTIFVPDPKRQELRPVARLGWGRAAAHSRACFKKGEGIAGFVWEKPFSIAVARLGPFDDENSARRAQIQMLRLREETAEALSSDQLKAQVLITVPIRCGEWLKGVLCIDCTDPKLVPRPAEDAAEAEGARRFWMDLANLATRIAPLLSSPVPRMARKEVRSDFRASLEEVHLETVVH